MSSIVKEPASLITVKEARRILGTSYIELSDSIILKILKDMGALTDIVITHVNDSKIQSSIDNSNHKLHTKR